MEINDEYINGLANVLDSSSKEDTKIGKELFKILNDSEKNILKDKLIQKGWVPYKSVMIKSNGDNTIKLLSVEFEFKEDKNDKFNQIDKFVFGLF